MVRVYRGVVSADQTILRQIPYAARGVETMEVII
jgi:hypothetical protein